MKNLSISCWPHSCSFRSGWERSCSRFCSYQKSCMLAKSNSRPKSTSPTFISVFTRTTSLVNVCVMKWPWASALNLSWILTSTGHLWSREYWTCWQCIALRFVLFSSSIFPSTSVISMTIRVFITRFYQSCWLAWRTRTMSWYHLHFLAYLLLLKCLAVRLLLEGVQLRKIGKAFFQIICQRYLHLFP